MSNEKEDFEIQDCGLQIRYAYHLYEAGIHDKSFINNRKLAQFSFKVGDLDLSERCYLRAIDDAKKIGHIGGAVDCMRELRKVYLEWNRDDDAQEIYEKVRSILYRNDIPNNLSILLLEGNVDEFNSIRLQNNYPYLSCVKMIFNDLDLSRVNLKNANLSKSIFINCILEDSDLSGTDMSRCVLRGVILRDSIMIYAKLSEAQLYDVNLSGAVLTNGDLWYCDCDQKVDFSYANLCGANLTGGRFRGVNFYGANLSGANLTGSDLVDADLTLSDLSYAKYELRQLEKAKSVQDATFVHTISRNKYDELCENVLAMEKVRFAAIFNSRGEMSHGRQGDGVELKLNPSEISVLLQVSWLTGRLLMQVVQFIGRVQYVVEQYRESKVIQIPVSRSELLFISTESDSCHHAILEYVLENITKIHDTSDDLPLPYHNKRSFKITHIDGDFPSVADYNDVCSKIYNINGVMFANFYDKNSSALADVPSNNKVANNDILDAEVIRTSILNAWRVWKSRRRFEDKIGRGKFAFAEYRAVKRLSVPLPNDVLLFVIIRKEADPLEVLSEIKRILSTAKIPADSRDLLNLKAR